MTLHWNDPPSSAVALPPRRPTWLLLSTWTSTCTLAEEFDGHLGGFAASPLGEPNAIV